MLSRGSRPPVFLAVDSETVIEIGDLVFQEADDVRPASDLPWDTDLETTQENFQGKFVGMAMQRSRSGDAEEIRVSKSDVFDMECDSATFEVGDLVGPADSGANSLVNQKIVAVANVGLAIGRVARRSTTPTTKVAVRLFTNN